MARDVYQKLSEAITGFTLCQKGVTTIEYTLIAVVIASVLVVVFNPSTGPFYDVISQAQDAIIAAIEDNT